MLEVNQDYVWILPVCSDFSNCGQAVEEQSVDILLLQKFAKSDKNILAEIYCYIACAIKQGRLGA